MNGHNVRVVVAAEHPGTLSFLSRVVEQESGVEIIGQAQDAVRTMVLTRNLRPDIVILDCYLPYLVGMDTVPFSRISGLDTAQTISQEIPKTRVMLLNNLDTFSSSGGDPDLGRMADYCLATEGSCVSITRLGSGEAEWGGPIFAGVAMTEQEAFRQKTTNICDQIVFFGALGFAAGLLLIITMALAPIGLVLAALGALVAITGLATKGIALAFRRTRAGEEAARRQGFQPGTVDRLGDSGVADVR